MKQKNKQSSAVRRKRPPRRCFPERPASQNANERRRDVFLLPAGDVTRWSIVYIGLTKKDSRENGCSCGNNNCPSLFLSPMRDRIKPLFIFCLWLRPVEGKLFTGIRYARECSVLLGVLLKLHCVFL